jgi:glycosyltransferase involved in cell wall biosynthesis
VKRLLSRLRPGSPGLRRPGPLRVEVVGAGAGELADALTGRHLDARAVGQSDVDPDIDVVVLADGVVRLDRLPRRPLRIGWLGCDAEGWGADLLEDLDEVLVGDEATASAVASRAVATPQVGGDDPGRWLRDVVDAHRALPSVAIVTGVSNLRMRQRWGDHHFAVATAKALRRAGWRTRVLVQAELDEHDLGEVDLVLLLAGKVELARVPGTPTVAWVIRHPDRVAAADLDGLDAAFVASDRFAARLREQGVRASALHQCTDPERFRPTPGGPAHELLFVGNSRGVRRRILADLPDELAARHDLAVYGYGWEPDLLDPAHVRGDHVPNDELPAYYSGAAVVLNDHWDAMRELAFPSNRLYDASACGAAVVSDHVDGLEELFGGAISTYRQPAELAAVLDRLLGDEGARREIGARARAVVVERHTFDHRVPELSRVVGRLVGP